MGVTMSVKMGCHLCQSWGQLERGIWDAEASHYLFGACGTLRYFETAHSMKQGRQPVWSCEQMRFGPGVQAGRDGISENHQVRESVSQVNEELRFGTS